MTPRTRTALLLLAIVVVGFVVRCRFIGEVFLDGRILPFDPDSAYQLWRIEETVHTGVPPRFDRFANAPVGAEVIYRDGFAVLVAAPARLLFGRDASRFAIESFALIDMALLGALSLLAGYLLARRGFGTTPAIAAAAIAALLPEHFLAGFLGRVDHHLLEPSLPVLALALLLGAPAATRRGFVLRAVGAGAAMAALAWSVPAAMLHVAVVVAAIAVGACASAWRGDSRGAASLLVGAAVAEAAAALLMLPEVIAFPRFNYDAHSALPGTLFAVGAGATALLAWAARGGARRLVMALASFALVALLALATVLRAAASYTSGAGVLHYINETKPMWQSPHLALEMHSLALPLVPVALVILAFRRRTADAFAIAALGILGFALSCLQARFGFLLVTPVAVALGATACELFARAGRFGRVLVLVGCALVMAPCGEYFLRVSLLSTGALATLESSEWLAANTPPVGERRGSAPVPYTIISTADDENFFAYLARRPVLATGLLDHGDYKGGFVDTLSALFGGADPAAILERRRVRYLVLPALDAYGEEIRGALRRLVAGGRGNAQSPTLYARLFDHDGSALIAPDGSVLPALGNFRLRHESSLVATRSGRPVPAAKIFERVAGARLAGDCAVPSVRARVAIETDQGRSEDFLAVAPCVGGRFALRIPYPGQVEVQRAQSAPAATAPATVRVTVTVTVTERDIAEGRAVELPAR